MLSDQLQCKDLDMPKAARLVSSTIEVLAEFRKDSNHWDHIVQYANKVATLHIPVAPIHPRHVCAVPASLQDHILSETVGAREENYSSNHLKVAIYFPVIDCMLNESKNRFSL